MPKVDLQAVEAIKESALFNETWYRQKYPDVALLGMDPVEHYLWIGAELGRNPSPTFDTSGYELENRILADNGQNALLHYIENQKMADIKSQAPNNERQSRRSLKPVVAGTSIIKAPPSRNNIEPADIKFSVIMPTRNRAHCIEMAINSLLQQTHQHFELVIVDDGSTDKTEDLVTQKYRQELAAGRIIYVRNEIGNGVCMARNIGLSRSSHDWIAYLDSDNTIRPEFLATFAEAVVENPDAQTFYANFQVNGTEKIGGRPFDLKGLSVRNYIDIGVFCHARHCYKVLGGFDPSLKRLVDWELILRYTKAYRPVHLPIELMDYCNDENGERITLKESYAQARVQIHRKHNVRPTISIIVLSYNQEKYIRKALDSIISQMGWFTYEIILSDDGSTDATPEIMQNFAEAHPHLARVISRRYNMGISENFLRCFNEALGEYVAVLEGDDYWESPENLIKKIKFLDSNPDCSMVFSKIKMLFQKEDGEKIEYLERQRTIKGNRLNGQNFLDEPNMNLIVNFSACVFRTELMQQLPYTAYIHRLSEITVAFFLEQFGPIGYLHDPMTVYRHHGAGTWTSLSTKQKLQDAMAIREVVRAVASPEYKEQIAKTIQEKYADRIHELEYET